MPVVLYVTFQESLAPSQWMLDLFVHAAKSASQFDRFPLPTNIYICLAVL